jgi:tetratricopeptide (TPR) repeat protein
MTDSIDQLRQAITFDPTFVPNYVILCWALDAKGDTKAALDSCKQALERQGSPWTALALARAQALAGDHAAAAAAMVSVVSRSEQFVSGYDRAAVYAALGRTNDAFAALEEGYQYRAEWMSYLNVDPQMDSLRPDPRYNNLLRRLGL